MGIWLCCRVGVFLAFQPTFSYDEKGIIEAIFSKNGEAKGIFGFIPEIFELIIIVTELSIELIIW